MERKFCIKREDVKCGQLWISVAADIDVIDSTMVTALEKRAVVAKSQNTSIRTIRIARCTEGH